MSQSLPNPRVASTPRASEWIWAGVGVGAASLSACFAAYMLAFGPAETVGRSFAEYGDFPRNATPAQRVAEGRVAPILPGAPRTVRTIDARVASSTPGPVDFNPTGSLTAKVGDTAAGPDTVLAAFVLRDVFDGRALVETPHSVALVSKGSVIAGAGTVLSIERREDRWTVVTSQGLIGGPRER